MDAAPLTAAAALLAGALLLLLLLLARRPIRVALAAARLPGPPPSHWLLGCAGDLFAHPQHQFRVFQRWDTAYGPVLKARMMYDTMVVVTDPDLFGPFLRPGERHLDKYPEIYQRLERLTNPPGPSMLTRPEDAHWRLVRRAVAPAFQTANLKLVFAPMVAAIARVAGALSPFASTGQPFDMDDVAQRLTIDVIGEFGFGRDFGACDLSVRPNALHAISEVFRLTPLMHNPLNRLLPWREVPRFLRHWGSRMRQLVDNLLADAESTPPPPYTLVAHILAIRDDRGQRLSRDQMIAELTILWTAGFETTAHTLTWAVFLISTHPEVEAAVLDELGDLAAGPGRPQPRPLEWADLGRLRHLSAAIQEAMRLYPAVSGGTVRQTHEALELAGHRLAAGTPILVPTWAVHRSPRLWERPDEFLPFERWLAPDAVAGQRNSFSAGSDGTSVDASPRRQEPVSAAPDGAAATWAGNGTHVSPMRSPRESGGDGLASPRQTGSVPSLAPHPAFMAFSQGTRSCVGQGLAVLELKAALALLLGRLSFDLAPGWTPQDVAASASQSITLRPGRGLWLVATPREALPGGRRAP